MAGSRGWVSCYFTPSPRRERTCPFRYLAMPAAVGVAACSWLVRRGGRKAARDVCGNKKPPRAGYIPPLQSKANKSQPVCGYLPHTSRNGHVRSLRSPFGDACRCPIYGQISIHHPHPTEHSSATSPLGGRRLLRFLGALRGAALRLPLSCLAGRSQNASLSRARQTPRPRRAGRCGCPSWDPAVPACFPPGPAFLHSSGTPAPSATFHRCK